MNAVETNVLLYVHDSRSPLKQAKAIELLETLANGVLIWQVACEYLAASRKLAPLGFTLKAAWEDVEDYLKDWTLIEPGQSVLSRAVQLTQRYSLSYWDAMIVSACVEADVTQLYSEDLGSMAYGTIDGVELINPFE